MLDLFWQKKELRFIYNYIDDIYACCHKDQAEEAFQKLKVIINLGLPMNPDKVFSPTSVLPIMGIVVHVEHGTFSIEGKKLDEIHCLCLQSFVREYMSKREFQLLLGKLLYISRCVRSSRSFLNKLLALLHMYHTANRI